MSRNIYQFFCTFCSYKKLSDGTDLGDLKEIPRCGVLKSAVAQRKNFKETGPSEEYLQKTLNQIKQFKCPKCGFAIRAQKILPVEKPIDE